MPRTRRDILYLTYLQDSGYFSDGQYKSSNAFFAAQGWTEWQVKHLIQELRDDGLIDGQFEFLNFLRELDPAGMYHPYSADAQIAFVAITPKGERYLDINKERDVHLRLAGKNLWAFRIVFLCAVLGTLFSGLQLCLSLKQAGIYPYARQEQPIRDTSITTAHPAPVDTVPVSAAGINVLCGPCDSAYVAH